MTDFRNLDNDPFDPNDPYRRDAKLDPNLRPANAVTGWVVAAVFAVAILAVIFGLSHQPGQIGTNTASNDMGPNTPPAVTHMAPPVARRRRRRHRRRRSAQRRHRRNQAISNKAANIITTKANSPGHGRGCFMFCLMTTSA